MQKLLQKIADFIPTVHGWCSVEKAQWLAHWIVNQRATKVVEIGVFGGSSFVPIAMSVDYHARLNGTEPGVVTGIDPYSNDTAETNDLDEANKKWWKEVDLVSVYKCARDAVERMGVSHVARFVLLQSKDAVGRFDDLTLDLVHVDGSHNETESTRDVRLWWPKLRTGGIMVMDDTDWTQVQAARRIAGAIGKCVHHAEKWEVYEKLTASSPVS